MRSGSDAEPIEIPAKANFALRGAGAPVILVHGLSASLHDWDALVPELVKAGYATYAVDLLGHGDSPKPAERLYEMEWLVGHFVSWMQGLDLPALPVLIGHSLGGFIVLEYARRFPERVCGLVLVDPFFSREQLPWTLRLAYAHPAISAFFLAHTPGWVARAAVDGMSLLIGHSKGGLHALPRDVREQTAVDYLRTAPAAYGILRGRIDLMPYLGAIAAPTLVLWGQQDTTLSPASFTSLVEAMPHAVGRSRPTGHVLHQVEPEWFAAEVLGFLSSLTTAPDPRA